MRIRTDYEDAIYTLVPYFRARASEIMSKEYGTRQGAIASMLGITQAAVSKYLSKPVNAGSSKELHIEGEDAYVRKFISSKMAGDDKSAQKALCGLCQAYRKFACNLSVK